MADNTKIEWADATLNYVNGCSVLSPGCTNCYAMKQAHRFPVRQGLTMKTKGGMVWTGEVRENPRALEHALSWRRGRRIFWNAHGDLFHKDVPDAWIDRQFAVMALTPQHTHMVLTKRAERMREYCSRPLFADRVGEMAFDLADIHFGRDEAERLNLAGALNRHPLPNVWLGVSVEDQERADERIPQLLATPAAVRFLSCEPLLGELNLEPWLAPEKFCQGCDDGEGYGTRCSRTDIPREEQCPWIRAVQNVTEHGPFSEDGMPSSVASDVQTLDWVIAGGESGGGARYSHPDWYRSLRDQCAAAGVPFMMKQWGEWAPAPEIVNAGGVSFHQFDDGTWVQRIGKKAAGRLLDGVTHDGVPANA